MSTETIPRKTWRQRLKPVFGLRALMIFVLLVGGGLGWVVYRARVQTEAVAAIKAAGGKVFYDWEWSALQAGTPTSTPPVPHWLFDLVGPDYVGNVVAVFLDVNNTGGKVDDALMARIARLDHLEWLSLIGNPTVNDDSLVHLRKLTRLRHLDFSMTGVRGPGLRHLKSLRELRQLNLMGVPLNGTDLAQIKDSTLLTSLVLASADLTDQDLEILSHFHDLTTLGVRCAQITDAGLSHLKGLSHLDSLYIGESKIGSLQTLAGLKEMKHLGLGSKFDDAGLGSLSAFPKLESLVISGATVTDAGLEAIGRLTTLKLLSFYDMRLTDSGLVHFSGLSELLRLQLIKTTITDAGLPHLYGLQQLRYLDLRLSEVTPAGVAAIEAKLPALNVTGLAPGAVVQKRP